MRSSTAMGLLVAALIPISAHLTWTESANTSSSAPVLVSETSPKAIETTLFVLARNTELHDGMKATERYLSSEFTRARNREIETAVYMANNTREERFAEARNLEINAGMKTSDAARPMLLAEVQNKAAEDGMARTEKRRMLAFTFERNAEINSAMQMAALVRPELQVAARNSEIENGMKLAEMGRLDMFAEARNREIERASIRTFAALQNREATRLAALSGEVRAYLASVAGNSTIHTGSIETPDACRTKR